MCTYVLVNLHTVHKKWTVEKGKMVGDQPLALFKTLIVKEKNFGRK